MNAPQLITNASLAIATAMPSMAFGESSVYASLRQSLVYTDNGAATGDTDDVSVVDQESRVGLQASQEFDGYRGFGRVEFGFEGNDQISSPMVRLGFVGISGDFGAISIGSQWTAWDTYVGDEDTNFVTEGDWQNGTERNGDTLKYAGRLGGLSIEADLVLVESEGEANSGLLDELQLALGYSIGSFTLQGAWIERDGGSTGYLGGGSLFGARLSYDAGPLGLALAVAQDDEDFEGVEETLGVKFKASYSTGPNTMLAVLSSSDNQLAANAPIAVALGYQHDLSNRARVSLELSSVDPDIAGLDSSIEGGVMYRHDW